MSKNKYTKIKTLKNFYFFIRFIHNNSNILNFTINKDNLYFRYILNIQKYKSSKSTPSQNKKEKSKIKEITSSNLKDKKSQLQPKLISSKTSISTPIQSISLLSTPSKINNNKILTNQTLPALQTSTSKGGILADKVEQVKTEKIKERKNKRKKSKLLLGNRDNYHLLLPVPFKILKDSISSTNLPTPYQPTGLVKEDTIDNEKVDIYSYSYIYKNNMEEKEIKFAMEYILKYNKFYKVYRSKFPKMPLPTIYAIEWIREYVYEYYISKDITFLEEEKNYILRKKLQFINIFDIEGSLSILESSFDVNLPFPMPFRKKRLLKYNPKKKTWVKDNKKSKILDASDKDFINLQYEYGHKTDLQILERNEYLIECIISHIKLELKKTILEPKNTIIEIKKQLIEEYKKANKNQRIWYNFLLKQKLWSSKELENILLSKSINSFEEIIKNKEKYLNPFNTYYNYFRFLVLKNITFMSTNDGDQLLKLQEFLISELPSNFNKLNKFNSNPNSLSSTLEVDDNIEEKGDKIEEGLNIWKESQLKKNKKKNKFKGKEIIPIANFYLKESILSNPLPSIPRSKIEEEELESQIIIKKEKGKRRKIVILLFTNNKIKMYINLFNEFQEYFNYFCTVFNLNILYTGIIPKYKNEDKKRNYYYFFESHYFYAIEIPYEVHQNELKYMKVLWILTQFKKLYRIKYNTHIQQFSNHFFINGIDIFYNCFPSKEYALKAFELVYLQPYLNKYTKGSLKKFKKIIKYLEKNINYSDSNSWLLSDIEIFRNSYSFPNYINISKYFNLFPHKSNYAIWLNSEFNLDIYYSFNFVSNAHPELLFRFLANYWQFDFISNKFYPVPNYFLLPQFSKFKLTKYVLNSYLGKKYFLSQTLDPKNTQSSILDFLKQQYFILFNKPPKK